MTRPIDPNAEPPITIRPNKGSPLARIAQTAKAGGRGALSALVHDWASRHEREAAEVVKATVPPPDVSAFD